jgi:hypothetical protein
MAFLNMRVIRNKRNVVEPSESGWAELFMGAFSAASDEVSRKR